MIKIYEHICNCVKTDQAIEDMQKCGVLPYKTIDLYFRQPFNSENFEFITPALFIDYRIDHQNGVLTVELHPIEMLQGATEYNNTAKRGITCLYRNALLRKHINQSVPQGFGRFTAISEQPVQTNEYRYHSLTMQCQITAKAAFDLPLDPIYSLSGTDDLLITGNELIKQLK